MKVPLPHSNENAWTTRKSGSGNAQAEGFGHVHIMTKRPLPDAEAASFISKHTVALLLPAGSGPGGVRPVGSGSLVTFDGRHFILTATHVWVALRKSSTIYYSAIAGIPHSISLHRDSLTPYSLDDSVTEEPEPFAADLTLLELHPVDYRKMETLLSFFSLEREGNVLTNDWVVIGSPGVLAQRDATAVNTLSFELRAIFLETLTNEAEVNGLDFLKSLPFQDPDSPIQNYQGLSGGGLWSVYYYPEKLAGERYEVFLIGVNFYQNEKEIRCLGRKAIKKLIQQVRDVTGQRKGPPGSTHI
jgi:hypothetical protein